MIDLIKANEQLLNHYLKGEEIPAYLFLEIGNILDLIKEHETTNTN